MSLSVAALALPSVLDSVVGAVVEGVFSVEVAGSGFDSAMVEVVIYFS